MYIYTSKDKREWVLCAYNPPKKKRILHYFCLNNNESIQKEIERGTDFPDELPEGKHIEEDELRKKGWPLLVNNKRQKPPQSSPSYFWKNLLKNSS